VRARVRARVRAHAEHEIVILIVFVMGDGSLAISDRLHPSFDTRMRSYEPFVRKPYGKNESVTSFIIHLLLARLAIDLSSAGKRSVFSS